ncbi:NAD(P)H-dependent flavin oxidoreductase [Ramlibacter sp.]|uniref:NAD(P)H-dependent flavin oxidoreductase n=1 Tax=Ramlibacter sp. TaxID=1917967 RepID=UPI002FC748A3
METRLTRKLGIELPIVGAPMGGVAGGQLAAAVSMGGGLGLIGGGYGQADWLEREFAAAGDARVGVGIITWSLARQPELLDRMLAHRPAAVMLSFGDPAPFVPRIREAGAQVICQVQTLAMARQALAAGADMLVAQGSEAGGHGLQRSTFTLVPEVADLIARSAPDTLLLAAGGVADGRGLAAALMLGADGALIGSRLLMSPESLWPAGLQEAAVAADGDSTVRSRVPDLARRYVWPPGFTARILHTGFAARWHGHEEELVRPEVLDREEARYWRGAASGNPDDTCVMVGEAVGLIGDVAPAAELVRRMAAQARECLSAQPRR